MDQPQAKICFKCGVDCTNSKRWKDKKGRYLCAPCAKAAAQQAKESATAAAAMAAVADDPLASEWDPFDVAPLEAKPTKSCPVCAASMGVDSRVCGKCSYDERVGISSSRFTEKSDPKAKEGHVCRNCGYSLEGLRTPRCPECGTVAVARPRAHRDRSMEKQVRHETFVKPVLMIVLFGAILSAIWHSDGGMAGMAAGWIGMGVWVALAFITYFACALMWIGVNATFRVVALQLLAICVTTQFVLVIASAIIPFLPIIPWAVAAIIYVGMLSEMLELDMQDAFIVAVLTFVLQIAAALTLLVILVNAANP